MKEEIDGTEYIVEARFKDSDNTWWDSQGVFTSEKKAIEAARTGAATYPKKIFRVVKSQHSQVMKVSVEVTPIEVWGKDVTRYEVVFKSSSNANWKKSLNYEEKFGAFGDEKLQQVISELKNKEAICSFGIRRVNDGRIFYEIHPTHKPKES